MSALAHSMQISYCAVPITVFYEPGDVDEDPSFTTAVIGDVNVTEMLTGEQWKAIEAEVMRQIDLQEDHNRISAHENARSAA